MDFWIFAGFCFVLYLSILNYLNIRRNSFFKEIASTYNLQFEKPAYPLFMKGFSTFYTFRRLVGNVKGKNILIEDGTYDVAPSFGLIKNILPRSTIGNAYSKFFIDGQEVDSTKGPLLGPKLLASKNSIELFLKSL